MQRACQQIRQIAALESAVQEFPHRAPQPGPAVAQFEAFLQQRLQAPWRTMRMAPDEVLGIVLGQIMLENSVLRLEFVPQLRQRDAA